MSRRKFLKQSIPLAGSLALPSVPALAQLAAPMAPSAFAQCEQQLQQIVEPVLALAAAGQLVQQLPVRRHPQAYPTLPHTPALEAWGRSLCGLAPYVEAHWQSRPLAATMRQKVLQALPLLLQPSHASYTPFHRDKQNLVDAAFVALGLLRAPTALLQPLAAQPSTRQALVQALVLSRQVQPYSNNWLLFAAAVECLLHTLGEALDESRLLPALSQHQAWYKGDAWYGDGPQFHLDYYNSIVIHPMLWACHQVLGQHASYASYLQAVPARLGRLAQQLQLCVGPTGWYPPVGRSIAYRMGVFHALALAIHQGQVGQPAAALAALLQAIQFHFQQGLFRPDGYLAIGWRGDQPGLGERYINTGSLYLCTAAFLPLGLPSSHAAWQQPATAPAQALAQGVDGQADHVLEE